jgi:hypothetical protein
MALAAFVQTGTRRRRGIVRVSCGLLIHGKGTAGVELRQRTGLRRVSAESPPQTFPRPVHSPDCDRPRMASARNTAKTGIRRRLA